MADPSAYLPLLRMSLAMDPNPDFSAGGDAVVHKMEPERVAWLKEAMADLLQNPVDELKLACKRLKDASQADERVAAFEVILSLVENIDLARDFHKLGGLQTTLTVLLNSNEEETQKEVQALCCQTVGTVVHNHPETQAFANELDALTPLCRVLERTGKTKKDDDDELVNKCLYALLGLVRHNDVALARFVKEFKGLSLVLLALEESPRSARTTRKALALLQYVLQRVPALVCATTAEHSFDVLAASLTRHGKEDWDCRQSAVLLLLLYKDVDLSTQLRELALRAVKSVALPAAKLDEDDTTVEACDELIRAWA